ncbi:MAG: S-methyl-5-thioribose kinase [Kiloniellales bacterium]|nr:S-methyl-5-thioribose kinase [Kiloniellales bacterium]
MKAELEVPEGYRPHDAESLRAYLAGIDGLRGSLGGDPAGWTVEEVGDGNLNLVFKVRGPAGGLAVKQALPYVRLVGESWPLPLSRAHYEHLALSHEARFAPGLVPAIRHYDETLALIAMELLEPHIILRRGMIAGRVYPRFVEHITTFAAQTLFHSSDLALGAAAKKDLVAAFAGNSALCKITEDLIFTEPYMVADNNRWTSPQLDPYAARLREDGDLKVAISRLKLRFLGDSQALIHGDLHTGSIMVTEEDTRVIDPEFAFMGPMGFDTGALVANLLLNYFAQDGHEERPGARDDYRAWVLETTVGFWDSFRAKFLALWRSEAATGDGYPAALFQGSLGAARLDQERKAYLDRLYRDTLGFGAAKMIRRIVGLAHNIDLEWIEDPALRARCEARALTLARELMVNPGTFPTIGDVIEAAAELRGWEPKLG